MLFICVTSCVKTGYDYWQKNKYFYIFQDWKNDAIEPWIYLHIYYLVLAYPALLTDMLWVCSKSFMTSLSQHWKSIWSSSTAGATQSMASLTCGAIDTDIRHSSAGVHDTLPPAAFSSERTASWEKQLSELNKLPKCHYHYHIAVLLIDHIPVRAILHWPMPGL